MAFEIKTVYRAPTPPEPKKETYYLKDNTGQIVSKFVVTKMREASLDGVCYNAISWNMDGSPYEYEFVADVYCKWDSCTHWWFRGEDYDVDTENGNDSYYHLCGSFTFTGHIRNMCFVWKLVSQLLTDEYGSYYFSSDNPTCEELCELMLKDYTIEKEEKL